MKREGYFWDMFEGRLPLPPSDQNLGWRLLEIDPDKGWIRVEFTAKPEFSNPVGVVQGGYLAAMLDCTMGPALVAQLEPGYFAPTIELKINFIRSARTGRLIGEASVVHRGKSICFTEGRLSDGEGKLVATATATHRVVPFNARGGASSSMKEGS